MPFFGKYLQKRGLIATPLCHISLVLHINVFSLLFCCPERRIDTANRTFLFYFFAALDDFFKNQGSEKFPCNTNRSAI